MWLMWGERCGIDHEMKMIMLAPSSVKDWKGFVNVNQIVLQHVLLYTDTIFTHNQSLIKLYLIKIDPNVFFFKLIYNRVKHAYSGVPEMTSFDLF